MRVVLNHDVPDLGELGDVKDVAPGFARNFLFPRNLAFAHNLKTIALFEKRKTEIDATKAAKRSASSSLKEKIEAEELSITLPAGANGKLYGAVTGHTVADELMKKGIEIDRKRIEVPGRSIKNVGNYKVLIRLYEKDEASLRLAVHGAAVKVETREEAPRPRRRRYEERHEEQDDGALPEPDFGRDDRA
ncbi:MAG: 50S ribosomal protein L9 [Spirochaetaceae bacterium]|nr:50S ribosomal protein L9 [Spirochaetaceae bacterium]